MGKGPESRGCGVHPSSLKKFEGSAGVEGRPPRRCRGTGRRRGEVLNVLEMPGLWEMLFPWVQPPGDFTLGSALKEAHSWDLDGAARVSRSWAGHGARGPLPGTPKAVPSRGPAFRNNLCEPEPLQHGA